MSSSTTRPRMGFTNLRSVTAVPLLALVLSAGGARADSWILTQRNFPQLPAYLHHNRARAGAQIFDAVERQSQPREVILTRVDQRYDMRCQALYTWQDPPKQVPTGRHFEIPMTARWLRTQGRFRCHGFRIQVDTKAGNVQLTDGRIGDPSGKVGHQKVSARARIITLRQGTPDEVEIWVALNSGSGSYVKVASYVYRRSGSGGRTGPTDGGGGGGKYPVMSRAVAGLNFFGGDITHVVLRRADPNACARECERDRRCKSWSYIRPGVQGPRALCWIKDGTGRPTRDRNATSGVKLPPGGFQDLPGKNIPGADLRHRWLDVPEPLLCEAECAQDSRCRAYSYIRPGVQGQKALCWFKSGAPSVVSDRNAHSGIKRR